MIQDGPHRFHTETLERGIGLPHVGLRFPSRLAQADRSDLDDIDALHVAQRAEEKIAGYGPGLGDTRSMGMICAQRDFDF